MARLVGDAASLGPRNEGDRVLAEAPTDICDADWHRIEIRFAPELGRVITSVDDQFLFSQNVTWNENTVIRPTFGVHVAESNSPVEAQISETRFDPARVDFSATDVDDTFTGKILDPFWSPLLADPAFVEAHASTGARGLAMAGRGLTTSENQPVYGLSSPGAPLRSFHASAEIEVANMDHATFHLEIENEPGPAWRFAQVGFLSLGDGSLVPFGSGHFDEDGRSRFVASPEAAQPITRRVTVTFDYDARLRRAHASFCGRPFFDEHVDLPPLARAHFDVGANVDAKGSLDLAVRSLHVAHSD